ncbi:hypothetical protein HPG69_016263 [Diceros bicornis minor]|uniref:Uncharacterized protein n=1 Tax=Diceros bicornis minor TaxID=77932 RepID=A0A7J7EWK3_DICBM|nr:hypothetical protein HPG69_016263 [Diceros bicornis minor]
MNPTYQIRSLYKNMTQDRHREEEGNAAYTGKEIVFHARRAQESGVAAELTTRKLEDLRRENDHTGQMPATVESTARPFPSSPSATPPAAPRGPEVWGDPWGHQVPRQGGGSRSEIWGQLQKKVPESHKESCLTYQTRFQLDTFHPNGADEETEMEQVAELCQGEGKDQGWGSQCSQQGKDHQT